MIPPSIVSCRFRLFLSLIPPSPYATNRMEAQKFLCCDATEKAEACKDDEFLALTRVLNAERSRMYLTPYNGTDKGRWSWGDRPAHMLK